MISSETPYKLAEIIRDTWPNLYRPPANVEKPTQNSPTLCEHCISDAYVPNIFKML